MWRRSSPLLGRTGERDDETTSSARQPALSSPRCDEVEADPTRSDVRPYCRTALVCGWSRLGGERRAYRVQVQYREMYESKVLRRRMRSAPDKVDAVNRPEVETCVVLASDRVPSRSRSRAQELHRDETVTGSMPLTPLLAGGDASRLLKCRIVLVGDDRVRTASVACDPSTLIGFVWGNDCA